MHEIDNIRSEIDQIHTELAVLFRRRLALTKKIWEIKKHNNLPFVDVKREETLIHQFDKSITDSSEKIAVQNFLKSLLTETRKYLEIQFK